MKIYVAQTRVFMHGEARVGPFRRLGVNLVVSNYYSMGLYDNS